ncbi:MAG TPA: hypothetical protein VF136_11725 [Methylomirabilota bacterium]
MSTAARKRCLMAKDAIMKTMALAEAASLVAVITHMKASGPERGNAATLFDRCGDPGGVGLAACSPWLRHPAHPATGHLALDALQQDCDLPARGVRRARLVREAAIAPDGLDRVQLDGGPLGPGLDGGKVLMTRTAEVHVWNELLAWAGMIGAVVLIAGCSAPVLRAPSFVDAPAYDSPRCEDARRLDAQAATWWLPASCFKASAR